MDNKICNYNNYTEHYIYHPNGKFCYSYRKLDKSLQVYKVNRSKNDLSPLQQISLFTDDFDLDNHMSEIHVSKDGLSLFACNKSHRIINEFKISPEKGIVTLKNHYTNSDNKLLAM